MKNIYVEYTVKHTQRLSIPDDEFEDFTHEVLECNLETGDGDLVEVVEITVNGQPQYF